MKRILFTLATISLLSCEKDEGYIPVYQQGEELLTSHLSSPLLGSNAFGEAVPGLSNTDDLLFFVGNSLFTQNWVSSPASTTARDGLGPTFNARSCSNCHHKDGRGKPLQVGDVGSTGFLMRVSKPGTNPHGGPLALENYGGQIQEHAIGGVDFEAKVKVEFETITGSFADGKTYELQKPIYRIENEQFGSLQGVLTSPRVGPQVIGLGLIDAVSEEELLKFQDINDADQDGISGKANYVYNVVNQQMEIGRFGLKANQPNLKQQVAGAFNGDMGLTTSLFPNQNCPSPQQDCFNAVNGGEPEVTDNSLENIMIYSAALAVPIRRDVKEPEVLRGRDLFTDLNCTSCHRDQMTTGNNYPFMPILQNVDIKPYSDFLLHDMGEDLADNRPEFLADGKEWRTQPLWGIGMIQEVNGHTFLMHDGRARNIEEAILWHGGEAEEITEKYKQLSENNRKDLLAFINSL